MDREYKWTWINNQLSEYLLGDRHKSLLLSGLGIHTYHQATVRVTLKKPIEQCIDDALKYLRTFPNFTPLSDVEDLLIATVIVFLNPEDAFKTWFLARFQKRNRQTITEQLERLIACELNLSEFMSHLKTFKK